MKYRTLSITDDIYKMLSPKPHGVKEDISLIKGYLESDLPCMISRIGSVEFQALTLVRYFPLSFPLLGRSRKQMRMNAGFFPISKKSFGHFYELYKNDIKDIDLFVRWRIEELLFGSWFKDKTYVSKSTLDTFFSQEHPWTFALKGKRILVVHPFAETIESQYLNKREFLFDNKEVLPEFKSLETIKAVQSIAGNPVGFKTWFDALDWMKSEIDKKDFDIALLGCGAYALPLAAHIKRNGKKAIHMGGILQFLFGITSKRYDENEIYKPFINEYFVYPDAKDRPQNASAVEGGCYW